MKKYDDRTLIIVAITIVGVAALLGAIVLGAMVILGLKSGDDLQPGVSSFLLALLAIGGGVGAYLAPSPLSKTSGTSDEPTPVVGPDGGPVITEDAPKKR